MFGGAVFHMDNLCILATGGTIDKEHDPLTEQLVFSDHSYIPTMLQEYRVPDIPHETVMLKDSFDITDEDRGIIKDAILKRSEACVVVTHGTSTMPETAAYLASYIKDKTVVLTGAMRPFSLFKSDGGFNLGAAISIVTLLDPGVYIAMNGQIFKAGAVRKNLEQGIFECV